MRSLIFAALFVSTLVFAQRAVDWFALDCPRSNGDTSCSYMNNYKVDIAVSLFFQTESTSGGSWFEVIADNYNGNAGECPSPMTYSKSSNGEMYCLLTGLTFPKTGVEAYCEYLSDGYEGFTYPDSSNPGYSCPSSMQSGKNSEGTDFCTYNIPSTYTLPQGATAYCSQEAFGNNELGFEWGGKTTPAPSHDFRNNSLVYCSRTWDQSQQGSAGDCYFLLAAGDGFAVNGDGTTNIIGAHAVKLSDEPHFNINKPPSSIDCPASGKTCSYSNSNAVDMYITSSFHSTSGKLASIACSYDTNLGSTINVCNFTSMAADASSSSCNFILPSNKTMKCESNSAITVDTATATQMMKSYLGMSEPISKQLCPNATYPSSTMCDCYYENNDKNNDVLVVMQSTNANNEFNSFHCYVWGVNVCAWGSNDENEYDSGGCWFILPAGAAYNCSMEWGSTAFTSSTIMKLDGTIYASNTNALNAKSKKAIGNNIPNSRNSKEMMQLFKKWKSKFNKTYSDLNEEQLRFSNFERFVSLADNTLFGEKPTPLEKMHKMADLSISEYEDIYRGCAYPITDDGMHVRVPMDFDFDLLTDLPTSVDWRTSGAITPVKDQGQCGSCWAFSTTGVLSSTWFLKGNPLVSLSEQTLVSCETEDCDGCDGGWPYKAIDYVAKNGIDTEKSYPYTSGNGDNGNCEQTQHTAADISVKTYQMIANSEDAMAAYVAQYGPISISLDAMTQLWWPYTGGIMTGCCNKTPDHAVLIVGYNVSKDGTQYWIIKNSWGSDWGEEGYIWLEKGTDQCGITVQPVVPVIN